MTLLKKYAWYGTAVVASLAMALLLVASPRVASAAPATTVNVIIEEDNDTIPQPVDDVVLVTVYAVVNDGVGDGQANETIVTFSTSAGEFLISGEDTEAVQCAIDGNDEPTTAMDIDDEDVEASLTVGEFSATASSGNDDLVADAAEEGCIAVSATLVVPEDQAIGQIVVSARTTNGTQGSEILTIQAASGTGDAEAIALVSNYPTYNAIGYTSSSQDYNPVANGSIVGVQVTDDDGLRLNGQTIQWTTTAGVFRDATISGGGAIQSNGSADIEDACDSTTDLGTTAFSSTAGSGTSAGRAFVILCGVSGDAGETATVTATVVGESSVTLSREITISAKPTSADITATVDGNTVTAEIMVDGVPAPDNTNVRFSVVPSDQGTVASSCVSLENGKASTSFAATPGQNVTILVTATEPTNPDGTFDDADSEDADLCDDDARTYGSTSVNAAGGGSTPGTGGSGQFAAAPVFSASKLANVVFLGGTVAQLDAALVAAGATGAWAQNAQGVFVLYVVNGGFVNDTFRAAFPNGLPNPSALTVVGP